MTFEQRAGVHAALGEPLRLAIADHLIPGDASPGELAEHFQLSTNLLAHHLAVLEQADIIRRVRSEGDRRRNYVQLQRGNPLVRAALITIGGSDPVSPAPRVLFVCTANSARSQLAAASWNRISTVPATSAGTHPAARVHPRTITTGRRHQLRLGRATTTLMENVVQDDDLIIAVCDNAHEELASSTSRLHWSVPDPATADTDAAFETAYQDIQQRVEQLAAAITPPENRSTPS